jgi:5-oxoprolinase (ATP-hydrolysing)
MLDKRLIKNRGTLQRPIEELITLYLDAVRPKLPTTYDDGISSRAIVLMHGYRYPAQEKRIASRARNIGFIQVSVSHEVSMLMKLIDRGCCGGARVSLARYVKNQK